jgi:hypothetical protein
MVPATVASVGRAVSTPGEYERKAAEYLELAERAKEEWSKTLLLEMAQNWMKLAMRAKDELPETEP